jgi:hypothetical protein
MTRGSSSSPRATNKVYPSSSFPPSSFSDILICLYVVWLLVSFPYYYATNTIDGWYQSNRPSTRNSTRSIARSTPSVH